MAKHCLSALVLVKKPAIYCVTLILLFVESSHHAVNQLKSLQLPSTFLEIDDNPPPERHSHELTGREITSLPANVNQTSNVGKNFDGEIIASSDKEEDDDDDDDDDEGR